MAQKVTEKLVKDTCLALHKEGVSVTHASVTERMGAKGNNTNVFKWLREFKDSLEESAQDNQDSTDDVSNYITEIVQNLESKHKKSLESIKASYTLKIDELAELVAQLEAQNFELTEFKSSFMDIIDSLKAEINNQAKQIAQISSEKALALEAHKTEANLVTELQTALAEEKKLTTESFDKFTRFTQEFSKIRETDRERFETQIENIHNEKRFIQVKLEKVEEDLTQSRLSNAELRNKLQSATEENQKLESLLNLESNLSDLTSQLNSISQSISAHDTSLKSIEDNLSALQPQFEKAIDKQTAELARRHNQTATMINAIQLTITKELCDEKSTSTEPVDKR